MTVNWSASQPLTGRIDYPDLLTAPGLGIKISGNITSQFNRIGYFQIDAEIDGEFFKLRPERLDLGNALIDVPYRSYKLSVVPIPNILLIYPPLTIQIAQIEREIMSINYNNVDKQTGAVVSTPVTGATTSFQILAVDAARYSGTIYNQTNRNLWVNWGTTAATTANLLVPSGANLVVPEAYTGAVQGISAAGVTGSVLSQTVSFI